MNEKLLRNVAFIPKTFAARLEEGKFRTPLYVQYGVTISEYERWDAFRMVFDRSPFPPQEEWQRPDDGGINSIKMWKIRELVAHELPEIGLESYTSGCIVT